MAEAELHYFEARGRAEIVRLMLAAGSIPFKSINYEKREEYLQAVEEGKFLFKAMPMLHLDGLQLVQTASIVHYLARRNGMDGETPEEKAYADIYFEGSRDLYSPFQFIGFRAWEKEIAATANGTVLPKYLPIFENALSKSTSGYIVGSKLTYADVGLLEALLALEDFYEEDKLCDYPFLKKYMEKMKGEAWLIKYIKDIRVKPNDKKVIATVKAVLNF